MRKVVLFNLASLQCVLRYLPQRAAAALSFSARFGQQLLDVVRALILRVCGPVGDSRFHGGRPVVAIRGEQLRLPRLIECRDVNSLMVELIQILNSSLQFLQLILIQCVLFFQPSDVGVVLIFLDRWFRFANALL